MRSRPLGLRPLPQLSPRGAGVVDVDLPLGFTRAALSDQYPTRAATWSIPASGTWILIGTITSIGATNGTFARSFGASRGAVWRQTSTTTIEFIAKNASGVNAPAVTYTHSGAIPSTARRWVRWEPDGADTTVQVGIGDPADGDYASATITGGIGTGDPGAGADSCMLDQPGVAGRATAGTGFLFMAIDDRLSGGEMVASAATLLGRGDISVAPQPGVALGADVTSIDESGTGLAAWSPVDGATAGTHNRMTASEVTG